MRCKSGCMLGRGMTRTLYGLIHALLPGLVRHSSIGTFAGSRARAPHAHPSRHSPRQFALNLCPRLRGHFYGQPSTHSYAHMYPQCALQLGVHLCQQKGRPKCMKDFSMHRALVHKRRVQHCLSLFSMSRRVACQEKNTGRAKRTFVPYHGWSVGQLVATSSCRPPPKAQPSPLQPRRDPPLSKMPYIEDGNPMTYGTPAWRRFLTMSSRVEVGAGTTIAVKEGGSLYPMSRQGTCRHAARNMGGGAPHM